MSMSKAMASEAIEKVLVAACKKLQIILPIYFHMISLWCAVGQLEVSQHANNDVSLPLSAWHLIEKKTAHNVVLLDAVTLMNKALYTPRRIKEETWKANLQPDVKILDRDAENIETDANVT